MGTLPEAVDNSSLRFEIPSEKTIYFKEIHPIGLLCPKIDILLSILNMFF